MSSEPIVNPEDAIARDGRLTAHYRDRWPETTVAGVNFDRLFVILTTALFGVLRYFEPFRRQYNGTNAVITAAIEDDIDNLINQALNELWNRLRIIAETHSPETRINVFNKKAPSFDGFVIPQFFASFLSGIGPLHIQDTLCDTFVIYAPAQTNRDYFGRGKDHPVNALAIHRVITALRACRIPLATIQQHGSRGAFFTTTALVKTNSGTYEVLGAFHHSYYNRNDIAMAMLLAAPNNADPPFEDIFTIVGFVQDEATVNAFAAIAAQNNHAANGPMRHVGGDNNAINYFRIGQAADGPVQKHRRGLNRHYACSLARDLNDLEIMAIIRHRILHGGGDTSTQLNHQEEY